MIVAVFLLRFSGTRRVRSAVHGDRDIIAVRNAVITGIEAITKKMLERFHKERDIDASRAVNIESIKIVCLALGPYRNLTTLTASILSLHPNVQVLNSGHVIFIENMTRNSTIQQVLEAILDEFLWFVKLKTQYPERFFYSHGDELVSFYRQCVNNKFFDYPEFAAKLLRFTEDRSKEAPHV